MSYRGGGYNQRGNQRGGRGGGRGGRGGSQVSSSSNPTPSSSSSSSSQQGDLNGEYVKENVGIGPTFIDTHCHVEYVMQRFKIGSFDQLTGKAKMPHNFEGCISVFCDPAAFSSLGQWPELLAHSKRFNGMLGSFGCHPHNAKYYDEKMAARIEECLKHDKAVAWGECGLDFVKNESPRDKQISAFIDQVLRAVKLNKPLVVHSRNAEKETYDIFKEHMPKDWRVHVHCFGDSAAQAKRLLEDFPNVYLGFTGSITFTNAEDLRATIRDIVPLNRILLETDAPYMTPNPYKGTCHSGHIPVIANEIAKLKGLSLQDTLKQIRENTKAMYGI